MSKKVVLDIKTLFYIDYILYVEHLKRNGMLNAVLPIEDFNNLMVDNSVKNIIESAGWEYKDDLDIPITELIRESPLTKAGRIFKTFNTNEVVTILVDSKFNDDNLRSALVEVLSHECDIILINESLTSELVEHIYETNNLYYTFVINDMDDIGEFVHYIVHDVELCDKITNHHSVDYIEITTPHPVDNTQKLSDLSEMVDNTLTTNKLVLSTIG